MSDIILAFTDPTLVLGIKDWVNGTILEGWVQPIFFLLVAVFAIVFIKERAWVKLASFVAIAAIVGVLIFLAPRWFGDDGVITDSAQNIGEDTLGSF